RGRCRCSGSRSSMSLLRNPRQSSKTAESDMTLLTNVAVGIVALLHLYFLVLEMFLWDKPLGMRIFGLTPELAKATKGLAANQGLYNGFLAAGLVWGLGLGAAG